MPGITVRMSRPRFLTTIAAGAHICSDLPPETLARDGVSPPWQVFEWWVVEAHARSADILPVRGGIPGIQKAQTAVNNHRHLGAHSYLKVPSVFGYTGVYRRLARHTHVLTTQGLLDEAGYRLLNAWMNDRNLHGFLHGDGPGKELARKLTRAVRDGLATAHTESRSKGFWDEIAAHLNPFQPGPEERATLRDILQKGVGNPQEVAFIIEMLGTHGAPADFGQEADFLRGCTRYAPERLGRLFRTIDAYECFCRPLTDLFNHIRHLASLSALKGLTPDECAANGRIGSLAAQLREAIGRAEQDSMLEEFWPDRGSVLTLLKDGSDAVQMVERVLVHHENAQRRKPPDGKRPWLERGPRGRMLIRSGYRVEDEPETNPGYVHNYRITTLSGFLKDLEDPA